MHPHFSNIACCCIDLEYLTISFDKSSMASECRDGHGIVVTSQGSSERNIKCNLTTFEDGGKIFDVEIGIGGPRIVSYESGCVLLIRVDAFNEGGILKEVGPVSSHLYFDIISSF